MSTSHEESLPERIRRRSDDLSPSQKKIARFCVTEPQKAGSLTALRIAEELRVSESTVVRFAIHMGYLGFPDMQAAIRRAIQREQDRTQGEDTTTSRGIVAESLDHDLKLLQETVEATHADRLDDAISALYAGTTLHVVGFRTSFSLSYLAEYHIRQVRPRVRLIGAIGGTHLDDAAQITAEDSLLAITFPVYDDRTIEVIDIANSAGATTVVITDSALAPLPLGDNIHTVIARHEGLSFFNSNVAAVALINAIVMRMVELQGEQVPSFARELNERFQHERSRR